MPQTIKQEAQTAIRTAIWLLFIVYCTPIAAILLVFLFTDQFASASDNLILNTFVGFILTGDQSLSLVHRAILPLMAGLAPIAFSDSSATRSSTSLMIVLILAIATSIFMNAVFHSPDVRDTLTTISAFPSAQFNEGITLAVSFFNRTQEAMGMYLLMLFGLTLSKPG